MSSTDPRREIPRTDALLADPEISTYAVRLTPARVRRVVASVTATARAGDLAAGEVRAVILDTLASTRAVSVRPVLNATGVIVHTNLGRAPLTLAARAALLDAAMSMSNSTWRPASGRLGAGARLRRCSRPCPRPAPHWWSTMVRQP